MASRALIRSPGMAIFGHQFHPRSRVEALGAPVVLALWSSATAARSGRRPALSGQGVPDQHVDAQSGPPARSRFVPDRLEGPARLLVPACRKPSRARSLNRERRPSRVLLDDDGTHARGVNSPPLRPRVFLRDVRILGTTRAGRAGYPLRDSRRAQQCRSDRSPWVRTPLAIWSPGASRASAVSAASSAVGPAEMRCAPASALRADLVAVTQHCRSGPSRWARMPLLDERTFGALDPTRERITTGASSGHGALRPTATAGSVRRDGASQTNLGPIEITRYTAHP